MANYPIVPQYTKDVRKLETSDPNHADIFNAVFQHLVNNDAFFNDLLKSVPPVEQTLQAGNTMIISRVKSPVGVGRIEGKTIVNLAPLFDSGVYTAVNTTLNVVKPNECDFTSNGTAYGALVLTTLKPGTTYTLSVEHNSSIAVNTNAGSLVADTTAQVVTFTTPANLTQVTIFLSSNGRTGTFTYKNLSLVEGTQAQPFVANVKGVTNPTIVNETNGTSLVVPTTLYEGEYVEQNATGELVKHKKRQELVLDGSKPYSFVGSRTDFKQLALNGIKPILTASYDDTLNAIKFNGSHLRVSSIDELNARGDVAYIYGQDLRISVLNTDSGWGDSYTPTPDEIKAYFLGYKMYSMESYEAGNPVPYNGTGTKCWAARWTPGCGYNKVYGDLVQGTGHVGTVPTLDLHSLGFPNTSWQPYRLIYELATPVKEVITPYGDLTIEPGENAVKVQAGRIVNEVAKTYKAVRDTTPALGALHIWNDTAGLPNAHARYRVGAIQSIKHNNKPVPLSYAYQALNAYGDWKFGVPLTIVPTAGSFTVDYDPLYSWGVTAPISAVKLLYFESLQSVLTLLTANDAKQSDTIARLLENVVNESEALEWITPTFLNGVTGAATRYAKDANGTVHLQIYAYLPGVMATTQRWFYLPKGYRPRYTLFAPSIEYTNVSDRTPGIAAVEPDGGVCTGITTAGKQAYIAYITFKAEN